MPQNQKLLLRVAELIRTHLQHVRDNMARIELPDLEWESCQSLVRQMGRAQIRGWTSAAAILRDRLEQGIARCSERFQEFSRQMALFKGRTAVAEVRDIYSDLAALSAEFDGVSVNLPDQCLSVTTESIELEEINLGPFEIRLFWNRIGERHPYDVVALEPNPCRESSDTTHPHVNGNRLCEGDGRASIDQALRAGRLLDFFQVVSRILDTYNSGSAYVSLCEWDGISCRDCGEVVCDDGEYTCDRCEVTVCGGCVISCEQCNSICCHSCSDCCRGCQASNCPGCRQTCDGCGRLFCRHCLSETDLCEECQEQDHAESLEDDENPPIEAEAPAAPAAGVPNPVVPEAATAV